MLGLVSHLLGFHVGSLLAKYLQEHMAEAIFALSCKDTWPHAQDDCKGAGAVRPGSKWYAWM